MKLLHAFFVLLLIHWGFGIGLNVAYAGGPGGTGGAHAGAPGGNQGGNHNGNGKGQGNSKPPIHNCHGAHAAPGGIGHFNSSAGYLSAGHLMSASARSNFQNSVNALAATYQSIQQDAQSGKYDTSQMNDMMKNLASQVNDTKLPDTKPVTDQTLGSDAGTSPSATQAPQATLSPSVQQSSVAVIVIPQPHTSATEAAAVTPADPSLAGPEEQILSSLPSQMALDAAGKTSALSGTVPTPGKAPADGLAGFVDSIPPPATPPLVALGGSGDAKSDDLSYSAPPAPEDLKRHEATLVDNAARPVVKAPLPEAAPTLAQAAAVHPSSPDGLENEDTAGAASKVLPKKAGKRKARALAKSTTLLEHLMTSVRRVQGAGADDANAGGTKWTGVRQLTKALFGPRLSSFFKPLDFPAEMKIPALSQEDGWWQALLLPLLFTGIFSSLVLYSQARHRRRLKRMQASAMPEIETPVLAVPTKKRA